MNKGFITLFATALIGIVSLLTVGCAYTLYKVNNLEKENQKIRTELAQQKEEKNTQETTQSPIVTATSSVGATAPHTDLNETYENLLREKNKTTLEITNYLKSLPPQQKPFLRL